ncbi:MAG: DUF4097 family beta strand repeat-containing protein [Propionibacteriaceae bacterium]|nr:DUF4097 family beta strand repeat-containing protein [Propionibacteriaceae bacterium]
MTDSRPASRRRSLLALGGLLFIAVVAFALWSVVSPSRARDYDPQSVTADGVTKLVLDSPVGDVSVVCDATNDFVLTQKQVTDKWQLQRDGDTVKVSRSAKFWLFRLGMFVHHQEKVTLAVPEAMCQQNLDAELSLSAGRLNVDARFDALKVEVSAGNADIKGEANNVTARVSAGDLTLNLNGSEQVEVGMSAGNLNGTLTQAPENLKIDMSAGDVNLALPPGNYQVNSDISAGDFNNQLTTDASGATSQVDVKMSAGNVGLTTT